MHKFTKQLLTGVLALGLLAPVTTQAISNSPQITVNAKSRWYKGAPRVLRHNSQWVSNPMKASRSKKIRYVRYITPMGGRYGFNPTPFYFRTNHHFSENGADSSAGLAVNAHTKALGHGYYRVHSGADGIYATVTVKVHNHNHISIWYHGHYQGYYHRLTNHQAHHFYYHPYF